VSGRANTSSDRHVIFRRAFDSAWSVLCSSSLEWGDEEGDDVVVMGEEEKVDARSSKWRT
jgi:hypothetical protein